MSEWPDDCENDLERTIRQFRRVLPGWWYTLGECEVSCHASCAPTRLSEDIARIKKAGDQFDDGFHADIDQPSTLAEALREVMMQAVLAKQEGALS